VGMVISNFHVLSPNTRALKKPTKLIIFTSYTVRINVKEGHAHCYFGVNSVSYMELSLDSDVTHRDIFKTLIQHTPNI
jgi:hypothetical protein